LEIAREARRALPSRASPVYFEARALAAAGRVSELNRALKDLEAHSDDADSLNLGMLFSLLARELETSGDSTSAKRLHDRAVAWFATLPMEKRMSPATQLYFGDALYRAGRYVEARPVFEKLIADSTMNQRNPNLDVHAQLGAIYAYMGDRTRADSAIQALLRDRPPQLIIALHWSARIAAAMGDKDRAVDYLRRQIALSGRGMAFHYDNRDLDGLMSYPPYLALVEASDPTAFRTLSIRERRTR
jgi:tetratricopeptide (TPR) repeat protein